MKRDGIRWKCVLFIFVFVFIASLTLTNQSSAGLDPCCVFTCLPACTPPTIQGRVINIHGVPICVGVDITEECWVTDCKCS